MFKIVWVSRKNKPAKYHIGDIVRVREDLTTWERYCMFREPFRVREIIHRDMLEYRGKIVTISKVGRKYAIQEDDEVFYWTDEMFCELNNDRPKNNFFTILWFKITESLKYIKWKMS